jgi:hypothetical protein
MSSLWVFCADSICGGKSASVSVSASAEPKWQASLQIGGQPFLLQSATANAKRSALSRPTLLYYAPLLKSALQKAIRRKLTEAAISIAYQFLRQEPVEFLRRLPIYMLEDTYLQPRALVRCVWLMCAVYKGWRLTEADIRFLLGVVQVLCTLDYKEHLCRDPCPALEDALRPLKESLSPLGALHEVGSKVGTSIRAGALEAGAVATWVRSEFGGLKGDMAFLRNLASVWLQRAAEGWEVEEAGEVGWLGPFPDGSGLYLLEGVDFHCYPKLRRTLVGMGWAEGETLREEEFRRLMWVGQSGVNRRAWLFDEKGEEKREEEKEAERLERREARGMVTAMRPFLETFARLAWQPQKAPKTIGEYFAAKV